MYRNQNAVHALSSSPKIYEVYLFVNPIGLKCYRAEQEVLKIIDKLTDIKIHFRFVTFHNFNTVSHYMKRMNLPSNNLQLRNQTYHTIYDACLAYKAALMQGKKRGRNFLLLLQKELTTNPIEYSDDLLATVAKGARLDVDMFFEDKNSEFVKSAYESDQHIAQEMNIVRTPSLVIFDSMNQNYGVLIDDKLSSDLIEESLYHLGIQNQQHNKLLQKKNVHAIGKDYLRVIK